jgi:rSAM/selenodomain-associated transferase 2
MDTADSRKISVIIPVYDEREMIASAIENIRSEGEDVEVIVVDGGSSDGSREIAAGLARIEVSKKGRAVQMNKGARIASGDILLFLHADTYLPDRSFECIKESFIDPDVIGGRFKMSLTGKSVGYRTISMMINLRDRLFGGFTGDQAIFIDRKRFFEIGGYKDIPLFEDLDMARKMRKYGKVVRIPDHAIASNRRWVKKGIMRTIIKMWLLRLLYLAGVSPATLAKVYKDVR